MYDHALTAAEILALYQYRSPYRYDGIALRGLARDRLLVHLPFDGDVENKAAVPLSSVAISQGSTTPSTPYTFSSTGAPYGTQYAVTQASPRTYAYVGRVDRRILEATGFTVSIYAKADNFDNSPSWGATVFRIVWESQKGLSFRVYFFPANGHIVFYLFDASTDATHSKYVVQSGTTRETSFAVQLGEWYHIALVGEPGVDSVHCYVDGDLIGSFSETALFDHGDYKFDANDIVDFYVQDEYSNAFTGGVDDFRLYAAALTQAEIKQLIPAEIASVQATAGYYSQLAIAVSELSGTQSILNFKSLSFPQATFAYSTLNLTDSAAGGNGAAGAVRALQGRKFGSGSWTALSTGYNGQVGTDNLIWPHGTSIPSGTLCVVSRYLDGDTSYHERILTSNSNLIVGHAAGNIGKVLLVQNPWPSSTSLSSISKDDWLIICVSYGADRPAPPNNVWYDSPALSSASGAAIGTDDKFFEPTSGQYLGVNTYSEAQSGHWVLHTVIGWAESLSATEMAAVASYFRLQLNHNHGFLPRYSFTFDSLSSALSCTETNAAQHVYACAGQNVAALAVSNAPAPAQCGRLKRVAARTNLTFSNPPLTSETYQESTLKLAVAVVAEVEQDQIALTPHYQTGQEQIDTLASLEQNLLAKLTFEDGTVKDEVNPSFAFATYLRIADGPEPFVTTDSIVGSKAFDVDRRGFVKNLDYDYFDSSGGMTFTVWVKPRDWTSYQSPSDSFPGFVLNCFQFTMNLSPSYSYKVGLSSNSHTGGYVIQHVPEGSGPLALDEWHHLTVTIRFNGLRIQTFVNASMASDDTYDVDATVGFPGILVGADGYGLEKRSFTGVMDEVRMYNKVLSPSEVYAVYRHGQPAFLDHVETSFEDDGRDSLAEIDTKLSGGLQVFLNSTEGSDFPDVTVGNFSFTTTATLQPTTTRAQAASYAQAAIAVIFDGVDGLRGTGNKIHIDDCLIFNFLSAADGAEERFDRVRGLVASGNAFDVAQVTVDDSFGSTYYQMTPKFGAAGSGLPCNERVNFNDENKLSEADFSCFYRRAVVNGERQEIAAKSIHVMTSVSDTLEQSNENIDANSFIKQNIINFGRDTDREEDVSVNQYYRRTCNKLSPPPGEGTLVCAYFDPGFRWITHSESGANLDPFTLADKAIITFLISIRNNQGIVQRRRLLSVDHTRRTLLSHDLVTDENGESGAVSFTIPGVQPRKNMLSLTRMRGARWQYATIRAWRRSDVALPLFLRNAKLGLHAIAHRLGASFHREEPYTVFDEETLPDAHPQRRLLGYSDGVTRNGVNISTIFHLADFSSGYLYEAQLQCLFHEIASNPRNLTLSEATAIAETCAGHVYSLDEWGAIINVTLEECGDDTANHSPVECLQLASELFEHFIPTSVDYSVAHLHPPFVYFSAFLPFETLQLNQNISLLEDYTRFATARLLGVNMDRVVAQVAAISLTHSELRVWLYPDSREPYRSAPVYLYAHDLRVVWQEKRVDLANALKRLTALGFIEFRTALALANQDGVPYPPIPPLSSEHWVVFDLWFPEKTLTYREIEALTRSLKLSLYETFSIPYYAVYLDHVRSFPYHGTTRLTFHIYFATAGEADKLFLELGRQRHVVEHRALELAAQEAQAHSVPSVYLENIARTDILVRVPAPPLHPPPPLGIIIAGVVFGVVLVLILRLCFRVEDSLAQEALIPNALPRGHEIPVIRQVMGKKFIFARLDMDKEE